MKTIRKHKCKAFRHALSHHIRHMRKRKESFEDFPEIQNDNQQYTLGLLTAARMFQELENLP
jgi:hypothetical protein